MSIVLTIAKMIAAAVTASLGLLGTLKNGRDPSSGKFTSIGKWTMGGIVLSCLVALSIECISYQKAKSDSANSDREKESLQQELAKSVENSGRILEPIRKFELQFIFEVQPAAAALSPELTQLREVLQTNASDKELIRRLGLTAMGDPAAKYIVPLGAPVFEETSPSLNKLMMTPVIVEWYVEPVSPDSLANNPPRPDLILSSLLIDSEKGTGPFLVYEVSAQRYVIQAQSAHPFVDANSGKLASIRDARGSMIVIRLQDECPLRPRDATLYLDAGRAFDINGFQHISSRRGELYYFQFPKDADFSKGSDRKYIMQYKMPH